MCIACDPSTHLPTTNHLAPCSPAAVLIALLNIASWLFTYSEASCAGVAAVAIMQMARPAGGLLSVSLLLLAFAGYASGGVPRGDRSPVLWAACSPQVATIGSSTRHHPLALWRKRSAAAAQATYLVTLYSGRGFTGSSRTWRGSFPANSPSYLGEPAFNEVGRVFNIYRKLIGPRGACRRELIRGRPMLA